MYTSLSICQRFDRLIENTEDEEIPAVREEINYLFATNDSQKTPLQDKYATLKGKRFCYRHFDKISKDFYSIAMKYHRQAEDCLLSDNSASNINEIHKYIIDLLTIHRHSKIHRVGVNKSSDNEGNANLLMYKDLFLKFTELPANAMQKLTSGLVNRRQDNAIKSYFHLMLDVMWLFLTVKENVESKVNPNEIIEIMQEIHYVMYKCYEKCNKYIVPCGCLKVFWLRMQLFCEELSISFWEAFNSSMVCYNEEFSLSTLKFLAELQCYSRDGTFIGSHCHRIQENVEFFNNKWSLLMKNCEKSKLFNILKHIESLISDLWLSYGKLEFYYLTWDYYNKTLEDIVDLRQFSVILQEIEHENTFGDANKQNGYLIFLRMLRKHLLRHPHHWNKFKGRVYTKFPPIKFQKLSSQGLHNLALLFFALGAVNFDETTQKFLGLLKDLPINKQNTSETWNIYIFMMKQHLDNQRAITQVHTVFNTFLEESSRNRNSYSLVTLFVNNLSSFFRVDDLTLKQSLLIGAWLENYLKSCSQNELISLLNTLTMIIDRTVDAGVWYEYQNVFVTHVLYTLKRLTMNQSIIGTVCGLIIAHSEGLDNVVEHFVSEIVPGDVMMSFFMTLRRKSTFTSSEKREFLTLKAWFLSSFIGVENQCLTNEILQLMRIQNNTDEDQSPFERILYAIDTKTLLSCLKDSEKFFAKNLNLNVYTNMALVFHARGDVLYIRTAATCYLSTFIDQFLLPVEVLRGSKPSFLCFVEKTWHLFMIALWQLNTQEADPYLERLIKDLTLRYIPHFSSKPTVVVKITNNEFLCEFVFKKLASEFFELNRSRHIGDETVFKALNTINTILDDFLFEGVNCKKMMIVMFARRFLLALYEVYMFKNHKVIVIDIVKKLAALRGAHNEIRAVFCESLMSVVKKHLAFSTNQYFQMMYVLVKIVGDVVKELLGKIREEISVLECNRGQGFDNHLRQSYDKLVKLC
ncbi:protein MMS22-like [Atheta coriaria]|uniref:protein MMS22-like n=1 Tax=Dalotia coriaria TaxID=877792 RepID=UPI0031F34B2D